MFQHPDLIEHRWGSACAWITPDWSDAAFRDWLETLPSILDQAEVLTVSNDRALRRVEAPHDDGQAVLIVKPFPPRGHLRGKHDQRIGTPGERSLAAAIHLREHGVGTPEPVGLVRMESGEHAGEEWLLTRELPPHRSFKDALVEIFRVSHDCEALMSLLQRVADAIRPLHACGLFHGDLGNQNILLATEEDRDAPSVYFVDLNRSRIHDTLSLKERARDLSRIYLPSDFLRILFEMIFEDRAPEAFLTYEMRYRDRFDWHTRTRKWRHPFREHRRSKKSSERDYPSLRSVWIWDEKSKQAITTMRRRERNREIGLRNTLQTLHASVRALPGVYRRYRQLTKEAFTAPVTMQNRVGCVLHITPSRWEKQRPFLEELGPLPVLIRFYFHDPADHHVFLGERVRQLHEAGFPVSVALVQNREAVLAPDRWRAFCRRALEPIADVVEWVEVGHAVNRVKWGCWSGRDYDMLADCIPMLRHTCPGLKFCGPAGIDFEYHRVLSALASCRGSVHFEALSHHLYVDRRGAPENEQGGFSTWQKCALARAMASFYKRCDDRLIISEVNWPLADTGIHSPVGSPYLYPGQQVNGPSVDENTYADYMIRYFLQALCSGMAERVYWWNLASHGFGLVDDGPDIWRARPAWHAMKTWNRIVGPCQFVRREESENVHLFRFQDPGGGEVCLAYSHPRPSPLPDSLATEADCLDVRGRPMDAGGDRMLNGSPVYLRSANCRESTV